MTQTINEQEDTMATRMKHKSEEKAYQDFLEDVPVENKLFPDEKIPYRIMFNPKYKDLIHRIILDHMLYSCSEKAVKMYAKECEFYNMCDTKFMKNFREIFRQIEEETDFEEVINFAKHKFKLEVFEISKFSEAIVQFYFLRKLYQEGSQKTFEYFKTKRISYKFKLDEDLFSLVGYEKCNPVCFEDMVNPDQISKYKMKLKSMLWKKEFQRSNSLSMFVIDHWTTTENPECNFSE